VNFYRVLGQAILGGIMAAVAIAGFILGVIATILVMAWTGVTP